MGFAGSSFQSPQNMRGMGSFAFGADGSPQSFTEIPLDKCRISRLYWTATDNDTVTPGEGTVPHGVVGMAWVPDADNDPCSIHWDYANQVGTFAVTSGPHSGFLVVWHVGTRA